MKKLTVIGRGTVGVMAVAHFLRWTDWDIDWIYDPDIQPTSVGEGTNLILPRSLANNIDFDGIGMDAIIATQKMGIWKRGWGNGADFIHTFSAGSHGMHFSAVEFQHYMFDILTKDRRVRTLETHYENYNDIDSDFIMVCTGSPQQLTDDFFIREVIPVNTATVFQCPWDYSKFNYSLTFAKKFGWVFGIPLKTRCSIGYVYNKEFNNESEVIEDVQELLHEFNLTPKIIRTLNFANYSRKINYTDRIAYNGNASYFLEPLEATSTGFADGIIRTAFDVWTGNISLQDANFRYSWALNDIESMIMLHYFAGSIHNTEFWQYAEKMGRDKINFDIKNNNNIAKIMKRSINHHKKYFEGDTEEVGTWPVRSYIQNIDGMQIRQKLKMAYDNTY
jgi:hypothetical protein